MQGCSTTALNQSGNSFELCNLASDEKEVQRFKIVTNIYSQNIEKSLERTRISVYDCFGASNLDWSMPLTSLGVIACLLIIFVGILGFPSMILLPVAMAITLLAGGVSLIPHIHCEFKNITDNSQREIKLEFWNGIKEKAKSNDGEVELTAEEHKKFETYFGHLRPVEPTS